MKKYTLISLVMCLVLALNTPASAAVFIFSDDLNMVTTKTAKWLERKAYIEYGYFTGFTSSQGSLEDFWTDFYNNPNLEGSIVNLASGATYNTFNPGFGEYMYLDIKTKDCTITVTPTNFDGNPACGECTPYDMASSADDFNYWHNDGSITIWPNSHQMLYIGGDCDYVIKQYY